jgi:hypothetical protein
MWQVHATGQAIPLDSQFSHDGVNYPANWLRLASMEERAAIGLVEVADPEPTPPPVLPPQPDWDGFRLYCLGGVFAADYGVIARLIDQYTSFVVGIQYHNPALVQTAIDKAHADYIIDPTKGISQATHSAILDAMVAYHLEEA